MQEKTGTYPLTGRTAKVKTQTASESTGEVEQRKSEAVVLGIYKYPATPRNFQNSDFRF